jgi:O-antigen/teichoic acid export membrane protein
VNIVFGAEYIGAAPLIRLYGIAMFFFCLTVVLMYYNLAVHSLKYVYIFVFFTFLLIGLLSVFHSSMIEMITILLVTNVALFLSSYFYTTFLPLWGSAPRPRKPL